MSTTDKPATAASWPAKGGTAKQPWEDDASDITPREGLPLLSSGSADPIVLEVCRALAELDDAYATPSSRGENAAGVLGPEELQAFRHFRADYSVSEDPTAFGGDNPITREIAENHVGPWTLEAILRAIEHKRAGAKRP